MWRRGESRDRGEKYLWEYCTNLSMSKINWLQVWVFTGSFLSHWSVCFVPVPHCFDNCINWLHQFAFLLVVEHSSRSTFSLKFGIYSSYSNRTRVVSHCGFHLHLMIYVGHIFICLYGISISSSVKYLSKSPAFPFFFPIELFPYCWVLNYILDTIFFLLDIFSCKDFPTSLWIAFSFLNSVFCRTSFAILLKSTLSLFNLYHVLGVITMISLPNPQSKRFSPVFFPGL